MTESRNESSEEENILRKKKRRRGEEIVMSGRIRLLEWVWSVYTG